MVVRALISSALCLLLLAHWTTASLPSFYKRAAFYYRCGGGNEEELVAINADTLVNATSSTSSTETSTSAHEVLEENVVYSRWRKVTRKIVRMSNGRIVDFDIIGQRGDAGAALVFAWDRKTKTATLVREYMPGCHRVLYGLGAGLIEQDKHNSDPLLAAQHELEEECHLAGGEWIYLGEAYMDKYSSTIIYAYLVLDSEVVTNPRPLDDDEDIEIVRGVSADDVLQIVQRGEMNVVGGWGALLAIQKLRELGEIS